MRETPHAHSDAAARAVGIIGLLGIGLIHTLDSIGKYGETRYLFWMYVGLILGSIAVSGWLLHRGSKLAWVGAGLLALSALVGYTLSRTTGLPSSTGDVGNWKEPLGVASLFVEGCLVALAAYKIVLPRRVAEGAAERPRSERFRQREIEGVRGFSAVS